MKEKGLHASQLMGFRSLPATILLARLEECNPDASNIVAAHDCGRVSLYLVSSMPMFTAARIAEKP